MNLGMGNGTSIGKFNGLTTAGGEVFFDVGTPARNVGFLIRDPAAAGRSARHQGRANRGAVQCHHAICGERHRARRPAKRKCQRAPNNCCEHRQTGGFAASSATGRRASVAVAHPRRGQHPQIIYAAHRPANAGMILRIDPFMKTHDKARVLVMALFIIVPGALFFSPTCVHGQAPDVSQSYKWTDDGGRTWHSGNETSSRPTVNNNSSYSGPTTEQIAAQQRQQDARNLNDQGIQYGNKGQWKLAMDAFKAALDKWPDNETIRQNLKAASDKVADGEAQKKREQQQQFEKAKQDALSSMKGISENELGLKGIGASDDFGLKGVGETKTSDFGLKSLSDVNTDPMVVDARNVPSGLPKSVDAAIPHTPAGDRMRKGFQAVQAGDWKAALAWFQDALNQEPGDPGLQRLVDLAQFTIVYRAREQTLPAGNNSTLAQATQPPNQNTTVNFTSDAAARAAAAFDQYVKKYGGEGHASEKATAVSAATQGQGYTTEELKGQLQQALKDYHQKHDNDPGADKSNWGPVNADEIIIGGKG
jgi:tetratricopeptide (TPR) repeat protein